jgi:GMP synthase (glutamine-hydrolysing)
VRPFLLLATRAEDLAADEEYEAFLRFGELDASRLERRRLEAEPLGEVDFAQYAGIILGGSPFTVSDEEKSQAQVRVEAELAELTGRAIAEDFPFLGACYGIGIIGTAIGATVDGTYGEAVSAPLVSLTDAGRTDPLFSVLPQTFPAFVGHKEAIQELPVDGVVLASSPLCPVQAFRVGNNVYATQFHPELDASGIQTRIDTYRHYGYFAPDEVDELKTMAEASNVHHPTRLVRRFVELYG